MKPTPRIPLRCVAVVAALFSLVLGACERADRQPPSDTVAAVAPSPQVAAPPVADVTAPASRAAILEWAGGFAYENADASQWRIYGVPTATDPGFMFQRMTTALNPCDSLLRRGALLGRIITTLRHGPLGLSADTSYVFVDSASTGWRGVVIPSTTAPATVHRLARHPHATGEAPPPAPPVGFGVCTPCCRTWCRFPD